MPILFLGIDARGIKSGAAQAKDGLDEVSQATETLDKKIASLSKTFDSAFSRTKGDVQQLRSLAQQLVAVYSAYKSLSALGSTLKLGVSTNQEWEEVFPTHVGVFPDGVPFSEVTTGLPHTRGGVSSASL